MPDLRTSSTRWNGRGSKCHVTHTHKHDISADFDARSGWCYIANGWYGLSLLHAAFHGCNVCGERALVAKGLGRASELPRSLGSLETSYQ